MAIELGSSSFSLLPKTLGPPSRARSSASEAEELDSVSDLLRSLVGKGSAQLVQQAQTITKSYTNIHSLHSEDASFTANHRDHSPERRPALGRKRAKFSLKPVPSNSVPNIDFSCSLDHIHDPEEYFSAFEQLENAEKELKKLRGAFCTEPVEPNKSTTVRKHRPGLLGRTASYKHHSSADADTTETFTGSQEEHLDRRIPSTSNTSVGTGPSSLFHGKLVNECGSSKAKKTNGRLQDAIDTEGSVADTNSNILEKLLSSFEDFDEAEGKNFLRESLQMKLIDAGKFCLPELGNIQLGQSDVLKTKATRADFKSSQISSPALKAISAFQRRVSLKDPLKDICSELPSDGAPSTRDYTLLKSHGRKSPLPVDTGNHDVSGFSFDDASSPMAERGTGLGFEDDHSPVLEADKLTGNNITLQEKHEDHSRPSPEKSMNSDSNGVINDKGTIYDGLDGGLQEGNYIQLDPIIIDQADAGVDGLITSCSDQASRKEILDHPSQLLGENTDFDSNAGDNERSCAFDVNAQDDDMQQDYLSMNQPSAGVGVLPSICVNQSTTESLASPPSRKLDGISNINVENVCYELDTSQSKFQIDSMVHDKVLDAGTSREITCSLEATVSTNQHLQNRHSSRAETNEEHPPASGLPINKVMKTKAPTNTRRKKKLISRKHSLAGAGTVWENGRRKSSRRRFRPLEHWRGERLLYGRIHESLSTVIGIKYASPGKDTFKVESYVSEEYADLVAQVARC
ncbi:uncharacterized protein LOC109851554 isoform X3 [Asparagus officinalis]|uniref:uncharacterized protein LOC109851554 isoform X3 n=1 Tax=Asparagus officinalis TaxID=4686 RepID=UPI00098E39F6|nr:uncharacterized protein LOC109851554 isoform X3 [Asparagus officinalis]